ncbi:Hsp20/alpha crystallin family protein [uncultured archaeon]|nr:Hsp20/alpha crystallin family protein [uncultured archaeon]
MSEPEKKEETPEARPGVRHMLERTVATGFFSRHKSHLPATLKLKADITEKPDKIILTTSVAGYAEANVKVSASENTIDVALITDEPKEQKENKGHEDDPTFHSAYTTPKPIDPKNLTIEIKGGILTVTAPKRNPKK